jgi:hypothetical protein
MKRLQLPFFKKLESRGMSLSERRRIFPDVDPALFLEARDRYQQYDSVYHPKPALTAIDSEFIDRNKLVRLQYEFQKDRQTWLMRMVFKVGGEYRDCGVSGGPEEFPLSTTCTNQHHRPKRLSGSPGHYGFHIPDADQIYPIEEDQWLLSRFIYSTGVPRQKDFVLLQLQRRDNSSGTAHLAFFEPIELNVDAIPQCTCCNIPTVYDVSGFGWKGVNVCADTSSCAKAGMGYGFFAARLEVFQ